MTEEEEQIPVSNTHFASTSAQDHADLGTPRQVLVHNPEDDKPAAQIELVDVNKQQSLKERIMASIMSAPSEEEDGHGDKDICRVCRLAGEDTLYHPCLCTGSIKYVHQDCLLQWLKYSKKDVCELCNHKFSFRPLYRADMPERLPLWDLLRGVFLIMARFMRFALTYTLVATCWLGLVPLMASRTHRLVFSGLFSSFFSSRILQLFSAENVAIDIARGSLVVTLFLCTFISLVWLREQIMIGGPAHILHLPEEQQQQQRDEADEIITTIPITRTIPNANPPDQPGSDEGTSEQAQQDQNNTTTDGGIDSAAPSTSAAASAMATTFTSPSPDLPPVVGQTNNNNPDSMAEQQQPSVGGPLPPNRQSVPMERFQPRQAAFMANINNPQPQPAQPNPNGGNDAQQPQVAVVGADMADHQRFVDELTWQRLLGLDGSFAFIEHVFWTISLNIVFNIVFLYLPAQIGASVLVLCGFGPGRIPYFELPISIMAGLLVILAHGIVIHRIAKIFRLKSLFTTAGMICLMLKVFLLVVTELVFFPILCGWWLDICSLPLTGVTLDDRLRNFHQYPSSSMFLHWLAGMVYVFYSASFILILRELLRPGVLWFIRNLHDPDFNPIQEMIEQPVAHHVRRLIASMTLFFSIIMLVVYVPLRLIKWLHPATLPYVFTGSADTPLVEYSFELVLLQVIMPTILEYSKAFSLLKRAVRIWCRVVGGWLQLDSYLLPAEKERADAIQREQQRQRARERLLRGDQEEQIGLLEALEAIEDDTTDEDEEAEEAAAERRYDASSASAESEENLAGIPGETEPSSSAIDLSSSRSTNNNNGHTLKDGQPQTSHKEIEGPSAAREMEKEIANHQEAYTPQPEQDQLPPEDEQQPEQQQQEEQRAQPQRVLDQRNLAAQHHALLRFSETTTAEDYVRPPMFPLRICILLVFVCLTAEAIALIFFFVPVTIGRLLLSWMALTNQPVHDLYTVAAGLYTCWLSSRLALLSREWAQKGWSYIKKLFSSAAWLLMRVMAASIPLLVVIPLMLGFYFQMLVISPLRVAIFQSPLFFPWKEWAMGVVHFKIICASVLMGPDWWLKTAFEQIYADGIWNFRLRDLYLNLVLPITNALAFLIAFPYVLSKFLLLFLDASREEQVILTRYSYPFLLGTICIVAFLVWQWQKLKMLAQKIRNDKYLIGTQLVNFYRDNTPAAVKNVIGSSSSSTTGTGALASTDGGGGGQVQAAAEATPQPEPEFEDHLPAWVEVGELRRVEEEEQQQQKAQPD